MAALALPLHSQGGMLAATLPISITELLRRTFKECLDDDCLGLAAQLSYYFFLALFPALLFLLAIASFFPLHTLTDDVAGLLGPFVSAEVLQLIQEQMQRLASAENGELVTAGVVGALWSSSAAIVSIVSALNKAYDLTEGRPWWKVRLVAITLTLGFSLFILAAFTLVLSGPSVARYLGEAAGLGTAFATGWLFLQWPLAFALVAFAIGLLYYFGPDADQDWVWISPGAIAATILWLIVSVAFKLYVANFTDYNASYGALGGVILLLLWFYLSGLAILFGAELNSEIDHASPHAKPPGEKSASGRRMIGRRAARAFAARHHESEGTRL